jgi:glycosyltransferase involved in cell wall biosynthesis
VLVEPAKPRVLFVTRARYRLPLEPGLHTRFAALEERLDFRVLASAPAGSPTAEGTFALVPPLPVRRLDGLAFFLLLPVRAARELRRFRPDVVIVQGAHEAAAVLLGRSLARSRTAVILDVHGDWRLATRMYGSGARRLLNLLADGVAAYAVRHADGVRTLSAFTTALVRDAGAEPAAVFPAFMDLRPFLEGPPSPLPEQPAGLFVGVLERYKNIDGLAAAWRLAAPRVPGAELRIVGRGHRAGIVEQLLRELPAQARWVPELSSEEIAAELDRATCLVLPSRREGLPRVVVEALCRGRPVVGARTGGTADLVRDDENGILVDADNTAELAEALIRVLSDRAFAERLAAAARPSVEPFIATPEQYAESVRALVAAVGARREPS